MDKRLIYHKMGFNAREAYIYSEENQYKIILIEQKGPIVTEQYANTELEAKNIVNAFLYKVNYEV